MTPGEIDYRSGWEIHEGLRDRDRERDRILTDKGLRIMRVTNREVETNLTDVLHRILNACLEVYDSYGATGLLLPAGEEREVDTNHISKEELLMNRSLFILPILFALIFLTTNPAHPNAPKLFIPVTSHDFGEITEGETVEYTFIIKNTGKGLLEIKSVTPDCKCANIRLSTQKIKAGEHGEIIIAFNSQRQRGSFTKLVIIETNDPVEPVKMIKFKGTVIKKDA